jgi:flagellar basal-body rod protein FlgB
MKILGTALGVHERALQVKAARLEMISTNIANADTPNFKARDIDFAAVLADASSDGVPIASTHRTHFAEGPGATSGLDAARFRVPFNTSFDGNTVEMHVEQAHFGKAAADYQTTLTFLENRIGSLRKALKGE